MNSKILVILIIFVKFDLSLCSINIIETKLFKLEKIESIDNDSSNQSIMIRKNNKSLPRALIYSSILPGLGQYYLNNWKPNKRVYTFLAIEILSAMNWCRNEKSGNDLMLKYKAYADSHWSFGRWIHDYYTWSDVENEFNDIFINIENANYTDIWSGHYLEFMCTGNQCSKRYIRTSDPEFKFMYNTLCNLSGSSCSRSIDEINQLLENDYSIQVVKDHHYYENIGKYDNFFSGWSDNSDLYADIKSSGELLAMSPNKFYYREIYEKANDKYFATASFYLSVIFANHAISMLETVISTKLKNMGNNFKISAFPQYDPYNKWGLRGINFKFNW